MAVSSISGLCHVNNNNNNNNIKSPLICPHGLIGVGNYRNNNSSRKRNRVRVCSSSSRINKDLLLEARWILNDVKTGSTSSSSSIKDKEQDEKEEEIEKKKYYVNTGNAIRTLRQDFPDLFYRDDLSFDIYRDDIVFKDPLNTFFGIQNYKTIFWALRFNGRIFFKALWVDIISVSQPVETTIMIRWTVHGIPRVPWETRGRFDATSEYKLDKNGKIYQHRVHNIALNAPPRFQVLSVNELIQSLGCPSTPKPTYFEISSSQYLASLSESKMESSSSSSSSSSYKN